MSVSIIIPCRNEEEIIEKTIRSYYSCVAQKIAGSEIIVVEGGSGDGTLSIVKKLAPELGCLQVIEQPADMPGHGNALKIGYRAARKEWIFQVDGDNQFAPEDFWKLYENRDGYDVVVGIRTARKDSFHRLILTKVIKVFNLLIFGIKIADANCPFRIIRREFLLKALASMPPEPVAPNMMMLLWARRNGYKTAEVPVAHYPRSTGKTLFGIKLFIICAKGFLQLLKFRFVPVRGR